MQSNLIWSYSMLDMFETCPKKWHDKYILKNKEPESPQMAYGNFIHKCLEDYVASIKNELPSELDVNKPLVESIKKQFRDQSKTELKMGLTKVLSPTSFFGGEVWGRGAADVAIIHYDSDNAFIFDWKTGKKKDKEDQVKILAMMLFKHYPKLQKIHGANVWLKENTLGQVYSFDKTNEEKMWIDLLTRLQKMYNAVGTTNAEIMTPSYLCGYCPVKSCRFNKS